MQTYKDILDKYKSDNIKKLIIYRNKINLGLVSNQNKAISLANGKFIKFISGDDIFYSSDAIKSCIEFMKLKDCYVLSTNVEWNDMNMNKLNYSDRFCKKLMEGNYKIKSGIEKSEVIKLLGVGGVVSSPGVFFSEKVFKFCKFNEDFFLLDDYPLHHNLLINDKKYEYLNIFTMKYRRGSGVTSIHKDFIIKECRKYFDNKYIGYSND